MVRILAGGVAQWGDAWRASQDNVLLMVIAQSIMWYLFMDEKNNVFLSSFTLIETCGQN